MAYGRIMYQNRAIAGTLTATGGTITTGYPVANLNSWYDWLEYRVSGANAYTIKIDCGAGGLSAQAVALINHNLFTRSARFKVDGSDNDADWTAVLAYVTPASDKVIARFWTQATWRYWRITINNNGGAVFALSLGSLFLGNYIEFPRPVSLPVDPDRQKLEISRGIGDTGRILGTAVKFRGRRIALSIRYPTSAWFTDTWLPAWDSMYAYPFVLAWDPTGHPNEAYFMAWDMDEMGAPYHSGTLRTSLDLAMRGVVE